MEISNGKMLKTNSSLYMKTFVGGIVARINSTTIKGCYNKANCYGEVTTASGSHMVECGGICGEMTGYSSIDNCYNFGQISGKGYYFTSLISSSIFCKNFFKLLFSHIAAPRKFNRRKVSLIIYMILRMILG